MRGGEDRGDRSVVERALLMRDVIDGQLESADRLRIGRVADVIVVDGSTPRVAALATGPEALAGRVHPRLRRVLGRLLGGRWERTVGVDELEEVGPTLRLRRPAAAYDLASGEAWVGERIVRRLPGSGGWPPPHPPAAVDDRWARSRPGDGRSTEDGSPDLRGADLIGARVVGPSGEHLGRVLDVELRPKDAFALDGLIVAREPAIARLALVREVGPRPGGRHLLVPWELVARVDGRTIRLASLPGEARPEDDER
jgi:sporulation protein YlmC with PRC-barrel domain